MNMMLRVAGAGLLSFSLAGCAGTVVSDVTTFGHANVEQGATVQVVAMDPKKADSLEFKTYANMVGDALGQKGFKPTAKGAQPQYVAKLDYSVDGGKVMVRSQPSFGYYGYYGYYGRPWGWGPYWGWRDPFFDPFYDPFYNDIDSVVVYRRQLHLAIVNEADHQQVFEAKVESAGTNSHLNEVMPYMIQALFSRYPGDNGKTVRVKIKIPND